VRIVARTVHIGAAALTLGAATYATEATALVDARQWAAIALLSGGSIVADDFFKWGWLYLRMFQSWVVLLKLGLLLVGLACPQALAPCLWTALVLGSVVSHAPGRLRHLRLL